MKRTHFKATTMKQQPNEKSYGFLDAPGAKALANASVPSNSYGPGNTYIPGNAYVHDPESLYNEVGQEQFLRALLGMQLHSLSFPAFGQLVRQLLLRSGYASVRSCGEGTNRKTWGEGGLEMLAFSHTDLFTSLTAIQLKQYREPIPRRFVDELRGVVQRVRADSGLIVATSPFSRQARDAAGDPELLPIHLIDGKKLVAMLVERGIGLRTVRQESSRGKDHLEVRRVFDAEFFATLETGTQREWEVLREVTREMSGAEEVNAAL